MDLVSKVDELNRFCQAVVVSELGIQKDAEEIISDALLNRLFDSYKLCTAALKLLASDKKTKHIIDCAWPKNRDALDPFVADGPLICLLNLPLMQARLQTTPIPDLRVERLLTLAQQV